MNKKEGKKERKKERKKDTMEVYDEQAQYSGRDSIKNKVLH